MTHRAFAPGSRSRSTSRPIPGYSLAWALSRDPDPRYVATSPAYREARPSIFHIKRDTTLGRAEVAETNTHPGGNRMAALSYLAQALAAPARPGAQQRLQSLPADELPSRHVLGC